METISNGSVITFNKVSSFYGEKFDLVNAQYEDCITATFQICKNPCTYSEYEEMEISDIELRQLTRWLNRKKFLKFKVLDQDYYDIYYNASFNISKIEINGMIVGLELNMETDSPFARHEPINIKMENDSTKWISYITSMSDAEGYIYPEMEITVKGNGDLDIYNALEDRHMVIRNCTTGEVIKLNYPVIETSLASHKIQDDFNWNFFRIANNYYTGKNNITVSIPCSINIKYSPLIKMGV